MAPIVKAANERRVNAPAMKKTPVTDIHGPIQPAYCGDVTNARPAQRSSHGSRSGWASGATLAASSASVNTATIAVPNTIRNAATPSADTSGMRR